MGVDAKTRQRQLWDILGKPEKKQFAFDPILTGKRIGAGRGEYWYGRGGAAGGGKDSDDKGDEDDKDKDGQDDKNGGGNQGNNEDDPRRDPAKGCPKPGDTVPGLKNLRDCATGRCINVGFTLPPRLPEGWSGNCEPPKNAAPADWEKGVYWTASYTKTYYSSRQTEQAERNFKTKREAVQWLATNTTPDLSDWVAQGYGYGSYRTADNSATGSWGVYRHASNDAEWQNPPPHTPTYPADACTEITSSATGFKPACGDHDPNIPPQFKGDNSAIRLCDANGNEITVHRNGKGWVYETATCTVTINDGGVVDNVRDKAP